MGKKDLSREAILSFNKKPEFTHQDIQESLAGKDISDSTIRVAVSKLRKEGLVERLPRDGKGVRFKLISSVLDSPAVKQEKEDSPLAGSEQCESQTESSPDFKADDINTEKLALNMVEPDAKIMYQIAQAIVEYPGETFTKRDILNYLRSKEETVNICDATVFNYMSRALSFRKIIEVEGTKEDHRTIVYRRGKGIIEVSEFQAEGTEVDLSCQTTKCVTPASTHKAVEFADLHITPDEFGELMHKYMDSLRNKLVASYKEKESFVNDLLAKQRLIEELQTQFGNQESTATQLAEKQSEIEKLTADLAAAEALLSEKDTEISEARAALTNINDSMADAPLATLVITAINLITKLIEDNEKANRLARSQEQRIADLETQLAGKKDKKLIIKSFKELGTLQGQAN